MTVRIAPSILSADFGRLADEIRAVEDAGADLVHIDVMDGRFVPNITIGPVVLAAARKATRLPLDVHLMIVEPERFIEAFAGSGADAVTVHAEACVHLHRTIQQIRALGKRTGVALNPHSSIEAIRLVLPDLDQVLVMTVNPGFGGQAFIPAVVSKIEQLRAEIQRRGLATEIAVDGGIGPDTAAEVAQAGADLLIAGAAVFGASDYQQAIAAIRSAATRGKALRR